MTDSKSNNPHFHNRESIISYARYALSDMYIDSDWRHISLNRLINRLAIFSNYSLSFCICRLRANNLSRLLFFSSVNDPLFVAQFNDKCTSLLKDIASGSVNGDTVLIKLHHTCYRLMIFVVNRRKRGSYTSKRIIDYVSLTSKDELWHFYSDILEPFGPPLQHIGLPQHIDDRIRHSLTYSAFLKRAKNDNPYNIPKIESSYTHISTDDNINNALYSVNNLISTQFDRIYKSPIFYNHNQEISNILVFAKIFRRSNVRFGVYYYDCVILISKEQRKQIISALYKLSVGSYSPIPSTSIKYPIAKYDKLFWNLLKRENGPERIIEFIERPLSQDIRLFTEYSLTSGTAYVNTDPFYTDSIGWIHTHPSNPDNLNDEHLRLACLYYILLLLSPGCKRPSLLTIPIRVAGAPWLTVTTVRDCASDDPKALPPPIINNESFQRSFLYYHSLIRPFERRLRRNAKSVYLGFVAECVKRFLGRTLNKFITNKHQFFPGEQQQYFIGLNIETRDLCRVFPFPWISFFDMEDSKQIKDSLMIDPKLRIWFAIRENPFFDHLKGSNFISLDEARNALYDLVRGEIAGAFHGAHVKRVK